MKPGILLTFLLFVFIIAGCREEVISPGDPVTNENEIVQRRTVSSYTFIINAKNISFDITDTSGLNSLSTRLTIYVENYKSGEADIGIFSAGKILHETTVSGNTNGSSTDIIGANPYIVKIKCENFTGQLKVQLTRIEY
jgi:hypothetical protein